MRFTFKLVDTKAKTETIEINIPIGASICGLTQKGQRPQTITLDYLELKALLLDKKYAVTTVLPSLAFPKELCAE